MNNNRIIVVLLALILLLLGFHAYVVHRQEEAVRKVDTNLAQIRQSLTEMRNKLPQMPGPGMMAPGMMAPGMNGQFPPGMGPQGDRGLEKGTGQHKRFTGESPSPDARSTTRSDPEGPVTGVPGNTSAASPMAAVLARLIVLEYRADMALTDDQTVKIKQIMQDFKSRTIEVAAAHKQITDLLSQKQRDYLKGETEQVTTKTTELSRITGKDDQAYADLTLEFLDKPIRAPASTGPR